MAAMDNLEFGASLHAEPQWSTDSGVSVESSGMNSPQPLLPLPELPNELIMFMLPDDGSQESPRKRRKVVSEEVAPELEHIVVKKSAWEIKYSGTKLDSIKTSFSRVQIKPYVHWTSQSVPEYLELLDTGESIFRLKLSPEEISEDLQIALLVYKDSRKWAKREGHLWTEFAISLVQKEGCDTVVLDFTIKWNTIPTPYHIHQAAKQPQFLSKVMKRYFSNPNVVDSKMWSPQDFYQSVHTPDKNDPISASMDINGVETMLYPFQKRSVQWLLRREGVEWSQGIGVTPTSVLDTSIIPTSFMEVKDDCGQVCFVSHVLGLVTLDVKPFREAEQLKGGILAEEMGLGKTVEIISLITLHRRSEQRISQVYDKFTATSLRPTGSTLIITPPSILQQWISEINKHSPQLQVIHYEGIKSHQNIDPAELLNQLATSDVVITTYAVLAAEIHFTMLNPEKTLRRAPKYPRSKSPLMLLSWWRCLIDEAQMIESGVSNAAVVARMIPRVNAWCVTGTPVRKNVKDLLGLLVFLRYDPYCSIKHIWSTLISSHKHFFRQLFGALALRHNKQDVREELNLPAQKRYVVTIPFTPVEEQYYHQLFGEMCAEVGLDSSGAPILDTWDLDSAADSMRRWLVRLRQTALHPEIGDQNKKALRQRDGPLRTIDQVLDAMMEQADVAIRTDQRNLLVSKLKRGQLLENSPRVKEALAIWDNAVHEASLMVEGCREQLKEEIGRIQLTENTKESEHQFRAGVENDSDSNDEREEQVFSNPRRVYKLTWDNSVDTSSRLGVFRNRLRNALEILHMGVFFRANAWFQIKSNEDMTTPKTPEFEALEKLETDGYDEAKRLRREILKETFLKVDKLMRKVSKKASTQTFVEVPEFSMNVAKAGIESRRIMEQVEILASALDAQADILDEWREETVQLLLKSLVDEDEGVEITGEEYEDSTKIQDEVMVYVQALGAVISDRHEALTGQENNLIDFDIKLALRLANGGEGPFPEKTIKLLGIRQEIKPKREMGSIRGYIAELRGLSTSLKSQAESGNSRSQNELLIVREQLNSIQRQLSKHTKATAALEKEIALFTSVMNNRVEYYRQLQQISDTVAPYEGPNNEETQLKFMVDEEKLQFKIATAKSKRRYLDHLKTEATNPEEQRICVICREDFEIGALTVCGHQYCKECIQIWWRAHHSCPVCKRQLRLVDLHEITYRPQELNVRAEETQVSRNHTSSKSLQKSVIYSEISTTQFAEIKNVELDGPSFTTKIDTLARHLVYLRESDPGAKSIIYSQFKEFLEVLAGAFEQHRIGYSSIDKPDGIERFKQDPSIECFLLHAKAHSSGLNLVNASHVFLCEPLLNTGLELQAIARVDRIGQHQETNVWLYLVDGTVEESIYQLSVKRRLEHIGQRLNNNNGKGKGKQLALVDDFSDTALDEANSIEMQQASLASLFAKGGGGGEIVQKKDLWECLFGGVEKKKTSHVLVDHELGQDEEVRRYLRAQAAEDRASGSGT